jgi:hypothetical protein
MGVPTKFNFLFWDSKMTYPHFEGFDCHGVFIFP